MTPQFGQPERDDFLPTFDETVEALAWIGARTRKLVMSIAYRPEWRGASWEDVAEQLAQELLGDDSATARASRKEDSEALTRLQVPEGEAIDLLERLNPGEIDSLVLSGQSTSRLSVYGDPPIEIDQIAYALIKAARKHYLGDVIREDAGEEGTKEDWEGVRGLEKGEYFIISDPVDGTAPFRDLRMGWSITTLLYRSRGDGGRGDLLAAVITSSSGEQLIYSLSPEGSEFGPNTVVMRSVEGVNLRVFEVRQVDPGATRGAVAIVAQRGQTRRNFSALFDPNIDYRLATESHGGAEDDRACLRIYTIGGAPIMVGFLLSDLEYIVVPDDQTVYDAGPMLGVLLGAGEGAQYLDARTGEPVTLEEMLEWFSYCGGPSTANPRPFRAGLLVRGGANPETTRMIMEVLQKSFTHTAPIDHVLEQLGNVVDRSISDKELQSIKRFVVEALGLTLDEE